MNKNSQSKVKYYIQSEKYSMQTSFGLCTLMEHQSLVDIAICCGSNVLHAHKVVLAASSPLFRSELEQNPSIEQVVITGCEFTVIRSLIEFIYCGETFVNEDQVKFFVAAARLFQMKNLENLALNYQFSDNCIILPKPQFISKKPKYPAFPFKATSPPSNTTFKPINYNIPSLYKPQKVKRKLRMEAEHQACLKEALASRLAIANLKKEIGSAPQPPTFIIEDTCTETTVENFIPNADGQGFVELNMNGQIVLPENGGTFDSGSKSSIIQLTMQNGEQSWTADKIKKILENQANSNVEIMFRANDGSFVTVTDEVLQNLQKDGLQYQVIDEDGKMGEIQELRLLNKYQHEKTEKSAADSDCNIEFLPSPKDIDLPTDADVDPLDNVEEDLMKPDEDISPEIKPTQLLSKQFEVAEFLHRQAKTEDDMALPVSEKLLLESTKFSPDIFFAESGEDSDHQDKILI